MVAGNADTGMADRLCRQLAGYPFEADQRIVGRAAAEIGDQNGRIALQRLGKVISGRDRLIDVMDFRKTEPRQRLVITLGRERRIGAGAGKMHGPAGDQPRYVRRPLAAGIGLQPLQKNFHQVFKRMPAGKDQSALKQRACRKGLDRLQETRITRIVDELADGRLSSLDLQCLCAELRILHEGKRGAHAVRCAGAAGKRHGMRFRSTVAECQNRVCRAEIKPERACHGRAPSFCRNGLLPKWVEPGQGPEGGGGRRPSSGIFERAGDGTSGL